MAHPQHNFTSNFNGSDGHNAELTLNINGVEKKYTPAGNDKTYNVPGVACIPTNLSSADLVNAIATAISGAALPVLVDLGADADAAFYKYSGRSNDTWTFTLVTAQCVYTIDVDVQTGTITRSDISLDKSVVHVSVDHTDLHAYITGLLGADQTPVLVMSDTDPVTPGVTRDFYFYPTARTGVDSDYSFIGYDGEVVNVATVHDDDTVTYATYGAQILPANIFNVSGPSTKQLTNSDVSNGYKDFTNVLYYGRYPNFQNFTFKSCDALVVVTLNEFSGVIGGTSVPVTEFTFEVYAGNESNPTEIFIRSVTKTDLTDTDDRGVAIQDLPSGVEPVWNCTLLGSHLAVVCDRITVRVKWKNPSFGIPSNRIKGFFSVAVINPSGMTEWPQDE